MGCKRYSKYSEGQKRQALSLRSQGAVYRDIARATGIPTSSLLSIFTAAGLVSASHPRNVKYSEEQKQQALELRRQGKGLSAIETATGIGKGSLRSLFSAAGLVLNSQQRGVLNPRRTPPEVTAEVLRLRQQGLSRVEIAQKTGVSSGQIKAILGKNRVLLPMEARRVNAVAGKLRVSGFDSWEDRIRASLPPGYVVQGHYVDQQTPIDILCPQGHLWRPTPNNVVFSRTRCGVCPASRVSAGELEVLEFVRSLGVEVKGGDREAVGQELDIYVPEAGLGIEYDGLYWHSSASPTFRRARHWQKYLACYGKGVSLLAIYEDEWKSKRLLLEEMIRSRCHRLQGAVILNARDLEVVHLQRNRDFEAFFEANHLDGHVRASEAWGLVHEGKLVCCASLRRNFNRELEIARLATATGYRVRGGAGRLIAKMPRPLVSFSNNRLSGSGGVYRALGFAHVKSLGPSYWYTDLRIRVWRARCMRVNDARILAQYPTETAQALGGVFSERLFGDRRPLYRIEDYGHQKWRLLL